jgi:hypothetical protein
VNCYRVNVNFVIPPKVATPPNVLHVVTDDVQTAMNKTTKYLKGLGVTDIVIESLNLLCAVQVPA